MRRPDAADAFTPTANDLARARSLIAEGWHSVSSKFRILRRWKVQPPAIEQMIREDVPEPHRSIALAKLRMARPHTEGLRTFRLYGHWWGAVALDVEDMIEEITLEQAEFRAFKKLGGPSA